MYDITQHPTAPVVPIEDLKDGDVCHTSQLLPTATLNVAAVYELAYIGLSDKGIAGKLRVHHPNIPVHFRKTIDAARAEAATDHLLRLQDTANGDLKPNALQHDATKFLLEKRLDPTPKDAAINIESAIFKLPEQAATLSVDEVNDL